VPETGASPTLTAARSLADAFEQQADLRPDAIAVQLGDRRLTYAQLDAHANRLARRLLDLGVERGGVVGVVAERGLETLAGMLGVLKAGAAYTPLDPDSPRMRLRRQLDSARASAVVVPEAHADRLAGASQPLVVLDPGWTALASEDSARPGVAAAPQNLCAVLFTSGSTGRPKGVALEHRHVLNLLAREQGYAPQPSEGALHVCAPQFDMAAYEIWASLTRGARLVCHPPGRPDPYAVACTIRDGEVAWAALATSILHQLVESGPERLASLRTVLVGGEALMPRSARRFRTACPRTRLVNVYGPAETTIFSFAHEVGEEAERDESIPIGLPVAGARPLVLDADGAPVARGERGELYIAGPGVARGYLHAPELTAERFAAPVADVAHRAAGERHYRTGDLVRERPDGTFEIHGRLDDQLKLRGYRVEPGEIELQLVAHPGIVRATVLALGEPPRPRRLVAFVVPADGASDEVGWKAHLAERLPEYMVPAVFVTLAELPLTANGKVDRRSLTALAAAAADGRVDPAGTAIAPASGLARAIAEIYAAVLGLPAVDPQADFFALGGESLLAVQALGRLRAQLGLELPLAALFEARSATELAARAEAATLEAPTLPPLLPRADGADVSASSGQAKALMVGELAEESLPYQSQAAHRIVGPLDVDALERALTALVARHEILRTTFPRDGGRWLQRVHEPWRVRLPVEDLRGAADREHALAEHVRHTTALRLDPEQLPLVRWSLARLDEQEHALVAVEHHVVHDGVSTAIVLRELAALYEAELAGWPALLPPPSIQYRDFVAWQRALGDGAHGRRTLEHWRARLAGAPQPLQLPLDRPRPPRQTHRGESLRCALPAALTARIHEAARASGTTPFALMLAVHGALLGQYGETDDVVVGSGFANRRALASEQVVGMVVNTVALRLDLGGGPTVRELAQRAQRVVLEAQEHQEVPFERVVEELAPQRAGNAAPLYATLFSFHDAPVATCALGEATLVPRDALANGSAKADLNVVVVHRREPRESRLDAATRARLAEDGLTLVWEYNADLFEHAMAERMLERYVRLLERAVTDLELPLAELLAPGAAERTELLALAGVDAPYEREQTLAQVFEARVAEAPGAPALTCDGVTLAYAALERQANRLAQRLRRLGVEPGVRVGLCVERSLDLVVALLAVAKAGGAYVPLDPLDPRERLRGHVEALGVRLVLTHTRHRARLPIEPRALLCLDDEHELAREPDAPLASCAGGGDAAYVMFTSGSTGVPKGVEVPHRAVVRLVRGADYVQLGPEDTVLALAPPAFDASTFEIWGALLNGARLVVAPPGPLSPGELADLREREHVGTLWLTAGLFHRMVDDRPDALGKVRHLLAGGDVLSPDHVRRALAVMHERAVLVNGYGPTETTTFACAHRMTPRAHVEGPVPIGRPIANARAYVLDERCEPVPVGVAGELWIGGDGVALGYANDAALTAERFAPDPFSAVPGARMYRSGDRVRWRADGTLAFLGRTDRQLKVRGFRIEPGEVEEALRGHPDVADAHVGPYERRGRDRALAAYVVSRSGARLREDEVRTHAAALLPAHALPAAWAQLERLPLTANGKVDVAALPAPSAAAPGRADGGDAAPADVLERRLIGVWERVLDRDEIGPEDDFFALGGHSLLAVELFDAVERAFGRRLPLATIFEAPTVRRLAAALREDGWEQPRGVLVTLTPAAARARTPLFVVAAGDGNSAGFGALARRLGPDQPLHVLQQRGINGGARLHRSVERMAACYLRAIRRVQPHGPYLLGGRCLGSLVAYEIARRLEARGEQVALLAVLDSGGPVWAPRRLADGTPFDAIMNAALRRDGAPLRELGDVFSPAGGARLLRWLAEPLVVGADGTPITRYLHEVYRLRSDVRDAFPDLAGDDAARLAAWGWTSGRAEHDLVPALLPPGPADAVHAPRPAAAPGRAGSVRTRLAWRGSEAADLLTRERRAGAALRRRERVREASLHAAAVYRARPYGGVVTLIRSEEYRVQTLLEQWHGLDTGGVVEPRVPGSHRSMLREPDVEALAAAVRGLIDAALDDAGSPPAPPR
jgi:amino acid adenylation domain-containing protein